MNTPAARGWLLDTSAMAVASHLPVVQLLSPLLRAGLLFTCAVLDLRVLALAQSATEHQAMAAGRLLAYPSVPISDSTAERARELQAVLARRAHHGRAGPHHLLVAATALDQGLPVLHYDPVFTLFGELCDLEQVPVIPLGDLP